MVSAWQLIQVTKICVKYPFPRPSRLPSALVASCRFTSGTLGGPAAGHGSALLTWSRFFFKDPFKIEYYYLISIPFLEI